MSALTRTCLRLAATAAVRDVTIAQERVFDSHIGAVEHLEPESAKPAVAIYTEMDEGDALDSQNGGPAYRQCIDLVFECAMLAAHFDDETQITTIVTPATDGELEASLDTLEAQIRIAMNESMVPLSNAFRVVAKRFERFSSIRFTDPKTTDRLAIRYVTYKIEVDDDVTLFFDGSLTGLDRLPEPFRTVAKLWPDDLPEKQIALVIADQLANPTMPKLLSMRVNPITDPANLTPEQYQPEPNVPAPPTPTPAGPPAVQADWTFQS